ncbi:MAG: histidine kinase, partial [Cyclobacteriaceae bacterium]
FNIGSVKQYKGDYDSALIYIEQSLKIDKEFGDPQAIAAVFNNLGEIAMEGAQYQKAKMYLDSSLYYSKAAQSIHDIENAYYNLFKMYELQSDFEKALDHHINYVAYRDSIFNTERIAAVSELQTKYETEKKEQQIIVQEAQIAEQATQLRLNLIMIVALIVVVILVVVVALLNRSRSKKQQELLLREAQLQLKEAQIESAIASQEQERKRFARDLHDGFGQFISVLNLNLKSLEKGVADPEQIFESSAEVLDQMYRELKGICFNLMPETLIKQGIVNGIKEFSDRINVAGKVSIEVDTFEMGERLEDLQEISLYRITQEWVNNILKYSDATRINIQLTRDESEITLMIEDDGMGFDKSLLTSSKGNGWKNLNSRANLIKGELDLDTTVGIKGSALILNCPVRQPQELVA